MCTIDMCRIYELSLYVHTLKGYPAMKIVYITQNSVIRKWTTIMEYALVAIKQSLDTFNVKKKDIPCLQVSLVLDVVEYLCQYYSEHELLNKLLKQIP